MRSATALSTARLRGWLPISFRRNSSSSWPTACASSSMKHSRKMVLVDVHTAPEPRLDVRIAHGVVDHQVWDRIAERKLRAAGHEALEGDRILSVHQTLRD